MSARRTLAALLGSVLATATFVGAATPASAAGKPAWICNNVYSATGAHGSNQYTSTCWSAGWANAMYRAKVECQSLPPLTQPAYGSWTTVGGATTATCPFPLLAVPGSGTIETA